jgi:6-phosphogluconolactonase
VIVVRSTPVVAIVRLWFALMLAFTFTACGGENGSSGGGTHPPQPAEFLFAADAGGAIETLDVDMNSGKLAGDATSTGSNGITIATNTSGTFLYAAAPSTNAIEGFSIDTTGALSTIAGSPFPAPGAGGIAGVAIDPAGTFLYATTDTAPSGTGTGLLAVFSIDSTSGALSQITGSPYPAGISPQQIVVAPSGQFLYICDSERGTLAFSLTSGVPRPISGSPFPGGSQGLAFVHNGSYIYGVDIDNLVTAYSVDGATGLLAAVPGSPFLDPAGTGSLAGAIVIDPSGSFLYTYNIFGLPNTISGFAINSSTGALSSVPGSPFDASDYTAFLSFANVVIDPSGEFLYASCADSNCGILAFKIDATTGTLTSVTGSPFNSVILVGRMATVRLQ